MSVRQQEFAEKGFLGPIPVLSGKECLGVLKAINAAQAARSLDWEKSRAVVSRPFYEMASHPSIVEIVVELLGKNVMLWGASIQSRRRGVGHPWHSDAESAPHTRKTVSVWIGLKNATPETSLIFVQGSHRFGTTIQEERNSRKVVREKAGHADIEKWALERDQHSTIVIPEMRDGQALFFDGQLWHGSHNLSKKTRHALLLQYATPDTPIRIPDFTSLDWPLSYLDLPKPPCLMISGSSNKDGNRFEAPPVESRDSYVQELTNRGHRLNLPLSSDEATGWKPYHLFRGTTPNVSNISCHVSSLVPGKYPHPPHQHPEEEILLLLRGEAELLLPDRGTADVDQRVRLKPGLFVYYPAGFHHTLQTVSEEPANYLMYKWLSGSTDSDSKLKYGLFDTTIEATDSKISDGFNARLLFEGQTRCLRKLHAHLTTLTPGAGYDEHVDAHDVSIIVLSGEIETVGGRYGPNSVLYFPAGEPHGMLNPGEQTARYLVFEFHGHNGALPTTKRRRHVMSLLKRASNLNSWKRKLKQILKR